MPVSKQLPRRSRRRPGPLIPAIRGARLATLACALALAGCASTGGIAPQAAPTDAHTLAASQALAGDAAATFPRVDWWRAFGDPQLDALIDEALAGTPSLAAADARVRQAQAQAGSADAARKPQVSATAQYTGVQIPETLAPPPTGGEFKASLMGMVQFQYAPDLWGGQRATWEAAVGRARAAEVDAQAARLVLASNIARTYIALDGAHALRDAAEAEAARSTGRVALERQRVAAGIDNTLALHQDESAIAAAQQQAQAASQQIDALRNALAALLGDGPDRGAAIARPQLDTATPGVPAVLPSELLGHRPDVVAARWRVEAAAHGIRASEAAFKPSVNLSALIGLAAPNLGDLFGSDAVLGFGGPALSLPIFQGEALRARLAGSTADYDLAVAQYDQALVDGLREVADALQAMRALDTQLATLRSARDAAQSAFAVAGQRYHAGLATRLDVLAAQRPLVSLDQQLAALRTQRLQAAVDLDRALGGGLELTR
jgi:NodT family efflux transporter outer membrane factor (OMF) lipoprotein